MKRRSSYKVTFLDRFGPAGMVYFEAVKYGIIAFSFGLLMFFTLGSEIYGFSDPVLILYTLNCSVTLAAGGMLVGLKMGDTAGAGAQHIYMGGSAPYDDNFSLEQALVMQRDYAGALHLYEQRILVTPGHAKLLIAAADLCATLGENHKRAAELYKEVQKLATAAPGEDIYVSNKLADLYLGKLAQPGKALVEFRRLMHRYPGSAAEKNAKAALDNLKPDLVKEHDAPPDEPESRVW